MKAKMGFMVTATVFLFIWAAADLGAAPPDFNSDTFFNECPNSRCGAPPSGGPGGGGGGGGPLIIAYTWGPVFSVQEDVDFDGHNDIDDNCMWTPNDPSENADGDDFGDACDLCAGTPSEENVNTDGDVDILEWQAANPGIALEDMPFEARTGNVCDDDMDGDGFPNNGDNCREIRNADQKDSDGDGIGDVCDADDDNDGVPDKVDNCLTDRNPGQENSDGYLDEDELGDMCDDDYDNDGLADMGANSGEDDCPNLHSTVTSDLDSDGYPDPCDNCPRDNNPSQLDSNGNGKGDACDV